MPKKSQNLDFRFLTEKSLKKEAIEITKWRSPNLRKVLPRGIYWTQPVPKGSVSWNVSLIRDYLVFGDSESHQKLVAAYIESLPKVA